MDEDQELIRGINSLRTEVELGHCFGDLAGFALGLLLFEGVDQFDGQEEANLAAAMLNSLDAQGRGSMRFSSAGGRCCATLSEEDSHREFMRLDGVHEQAVTRPLSHDELVQLQCFAPQARLAVDLDGQGDDLACAA